MTWPFENDTSAITKKLAKKSLQSEKRRNLMVVIAVALAAFLICFTGIVSTSLTQMQRNQVVDTYEAVWLGVEENDIETLKGLPEFERVGGYYMLGEELSEQGYHASYVYCDAQMMEITKAQMELLEGRVPEKANEVVVSEWCAVLVEGAGNLIEVATDFSVFGGQLPDSGKQLVVDGGNGYDRAYGCPGYGLPDKLGLAHVAGRKPFRKLGVFFLGHACLDYPVAVRRVVSFSHGKTSFLCVVSSH
jgi:hypothetical protein